MKPGDKEYGLADCFQKAIKRVKFGQRKPQLSDFIPCNSKGEPMEKPIHKCQTNSCMCSELTLLNYFTRSNRYQKALDKIMIGNCDWNGTVLSGKANDSDLEYVIGEIDSKGEFQFYFSTIESLLGTFELEPTESCENQAGL